MDSQLADEQSSAVLSIPSTANASQKHGRDDEDDNEKINRPASKILKFSIKRKKFDGCFVCQFCDHVFSFKDAVGKHQSGGKWGYKACGQMQEHDKWVPAECKEQHWRRDAEGQPLGPVDPNLFQRLHAQRDAKRLADEQVRMDANAADSMEGVLAAAGVNNAADTHDGVLVPSNVNNAALVQSDEAQMADEEMEDEGLINNESCEDQPGSRGDDLISTTNESPSGDGNTTLPRSEGIQIAGLASQRLDNTSTATNLAESDAEEVFSVPTSLFGALNLRQPATSLPNSHNYTNWEDEMESLTQRVKSMLPKWNPSWEPNLVGMPAEVTNNIISLIVAPSQLPDFDPEIDVPSAVYDKDGYFSLELRTMNKNFNREVLRIMEYNVPWVKVSIRYPQQFSDVVEDHLALLYEGQMCINENAFEGSLRPFLTLTFGYKIGESPPSSTVQTSILFAYSPRPFQSLCQAARDYVTVNQGAIKFLNIDYERHHVVPHIASRIFGFLVMMQDIPKVTLQGLTDAKLQSIVKNRMESHFEGLKDILIYFRYYMRQARAAWEGKRFEEAMLQYETGIDIYITFKDAFIVHPDVKATQLATELSCRLHHLWVSAANSVVAMRRVDKHVAGVPIRTLDQAISFAKRSQSFAGMPDHFRSMFHNEHGVALKNRADAHMRDKERPLAIEMYKKAAEQLYHSTVIKNIPASPEAVIILRDIEARLGIKAKDLCSFMEVDDKRVGLFWRGDMELAKRWNLDAINLAPLWTLRERPDLDSMYHREGDLAEL